MHIIIAVLTAAGGVLWGLYRLQNSGVNLNDFNPFYWFRRRRWQQLARVKPLHALSSPMEAAACLVVGTAKLEGEISREQKQAIIDLFAGEFCITMQQAQDLFAGSAFLLKDTLDISSETKDLLAPCQEKFTEATSASLLMMLEKVSQLDHQTTADQAKLIEQVRQRLMPDKPATVWH